MRIVPDSSVTFYSGVDVIPGEQHIAFQTESERNTYYQSKIAAQYTSTTMVRKGKEGSLFIDANVVSPAVMFTCNYLSFVNPSWGNKTFFGFILDCDYMNNETIVVKWAIDKFESWRFDAQYDEMTIERQHLSQADYLKNPYDPSVLEHRTAENLPINGDTEKPYYSIGDNGDGVFVGERLCEELGVDNTLGVLITFCDMDLASKDTGQTAPNTPSQKLYDLIGDVFSWGGNTSFTVMSPSLYSYYLGTHPAGSARPLAGSRFVFDQQVWSLGGHTIYPLGGSRIIPPITYVFIDGGLNPTSETTEAPALMGKFLDWFTTNGLTESIIGIYPLTAGMALFSGARYESPFYIGMNSAIGQQVRNKKLDLYPFTYYRLVAPNGDIKELKIEDFHDIQEDASDTCKIAITFDAVDAPTLTAAPINYKVDGISPHALTTNANVLESIVFGQFPTLPYVISGWESQRAAIANGFIANNTLDFGYQQELEQIGIYKQYVGLGSLIGEGAVESIATQNLTPLLSKSADFIFGGATADVNKQIIGNRWDQSQEAYDVALGKKDTAIDKNFEFTRPAYAQNKYLRSNGAGFSNFLDMAFCDILMLRVSLNPDILEKYDKYFDRYGLASGDIGIPRVINYMNGSTTASEIPQWTQDSTTFVKTANCIVKNVPMPVADAIAQMFNSGIRFYKPVGT